MQFNQPTNDPQNYYWFQAAFTKEELDKIYTEVGQLPFHKATIIGSDETPEEIRS